MTAPQFMISRYCAFALCLRSYLLESWHPDIRPCGLILQPDYRWIRLRIMNFFQVGIGEDSSWVEFIAQHKAQGKARGIQEDVFFGV